jgi:hypothetical protein
MRRNSLPAPDACLQRPKARRILPQIRGSLHSTGKSLIARERVAADAIPVERVSTPKFPVNREFCRIRPLSAILKADARANSEACSEIPYATEQGNILEEQGILPAKTKIGAG